MKRIAYYLLSLVLLTGVLSACSSDDESYDGALLVGKWKSGTLYYNYSSGGTGVTWDTSDDVTESEGKRFTWTLDKSALTHIYIMDINTKAGDVPKMYTVTKLTDTELQYKDDFNKSWSFVKEK